jgi:hypothetical protein
MLRFINSVYGYKAKVVYLMYQSMQIINIHYVLIRCQLDVEPNTKHREPNIRVVASHQTSSNYFALYFCAILLVNIKI